MKLVKRILVATLVLLGVAFLAIISVYLLVDDSTLVSKLVEQSSKGNREREGCATEII